MSTPEAGALMIVLKVLVCKTRGCKNDPTTAEREPTKIRTRAAASLLAMLIESKCDDALPTHRPCDQRARSLLVLSRQPRARGLHVHQRTQRTINSCIP